MRFNSSSRMMSPLIPATIVCVALGLSGCISSRSLIEDLAKTPHRPFQNSEHYASLNAFQQDFLYLSEMVREAHPEPYAAWSKEEFEAEQLRVLRVIAKDTSEVVFGRRCPAGVRGKWKIGTATINKERLLVTADDRVLQVNTQRLCPS